MNLMGAAQKVMKVSQGVLIGAQKEDAQVVVLILQQGMHIQVLQALAVPCIALDLPVRVAGDIHDPAPLRGHLVQAVQRNGGKDLLHAPHIRHRLKEGEVADVLLGDELLQLLKLLRLILRLLGQKSRFLADHPE